MAKIDYSKIFLKEAKPTSIGGQAVMEGIMMQGPDRRALAMRLPDGRIYLKTEKKPKPAGWTKVPLVRGCVSFFKSLVDGMKVLMNSADVLEKYAPEEAEEPGAFEKWLCDKLGEKRAWNIMMIFALVISIVITVLAFIIFPTVAVNWLKKWITNAVVLNLIEGVFRILLFVLYVVCIRKMKEIHTVFEYHGAEHKTIHCYENDLELTPENAREFYTLHPRCGTSFLVFVLVIALLLFSLLGWPNVWLRIGSRILLLPVIAGISYELLKWAGRSDNIVVKILSWPGLMLQRLTTAEPDDSQLEVAITALQAVLVDESEPDKEVMLSGSFGEHFELEVEQMQDDEEGDEDGPSDVLSEDGENPDEINGVDGMGDTSDLDDTYVMPASEVRGRRFDSDPGSVGHTLKWGEDALCFVENGKNEAMMIFSYITGMTRSEAILRSKEMLSEEQVAEYEAKIHERLTGVPVQYIIKIQEFMGLPFRVSPAVLIPRLDTEILVEQVLGIVEAKGITAPKILDMCTGSGAIGISLAHNIPDADVYLSDVDMDAMSTAASNAHLNKVFKRCHFFVGNMFNAIPDDRGYDILVSNPPYIESAEIPKLAIEVREHEPLLALDGGEDGLNFYRIIASKAGRYIRPKGYLALEIGCNQAEAVTSLLDESGDYSHIAVVKDLAGLDRVIIAERK